MKRWHDLNLTLPKNQRSLASAKEPFKEMSRWLSEAQYVLIGAGSGLSVDAGIDYADTVSFERLFPAMVKKGFRVRYQLMGYRNWSPDEEWGYQAIHAQDLRFSEACHPVYVQLLDLVNAKDYFVMTTNVDALFVRNGFDSRRIYTPQGDYGRLQCRIPCTRQTWSSKPVIASILPAIDPVTQKVTDPLLIPFCPNCGGPVTFNLRGGEYFIDEPYLQGAQRADQWLRRAKGRRLLIMEFGAGFNTPAWIRFPNERITQHFPNTHMIRVNIDHPEVPQAIADKSIGLAQSTKEIIHGLWQKQRI